MQQNGFGLVFFLFGVVFLWVLCFVVWPWFFLYTHYLCYIQHHKKRKRSMKQLPLKHNISHPSSKSKARPGTRRFSLKETDRAHPQAPTRRTQRHARPPRSAPQCPPAQRGRRACAAAGRRQVAACSRAPLRPRPRPRLRPQSRPLGWGHAPRESSPFPFVTGRIGIDPLYVSFPLREKKRTIKIKSVFSLNVEKSQEKKKTKKSIKSGNLFSVFSSGVRAD